MAVNQRPPELVADCRSTISMTSIHSTTSLPIAAA